MKLKLVAIILITTLMYSTASGQVETYSIKKTPFSTDKYDEFSPVYYKKGIVFCTTRPSGSVFNYSNEQNKGLIKINYIDSKESVEWQDARLFSKNLKTNFNDGPVTFSSEGDTIYYSRNLIVEGKLSELSSVRNKLGIFNAVFDGREWSKIRELRINNEWYNVTTPWISPDGNRLYFASDKPGGFGGSDLYYCERKDDYWGDPVNLGPTINTKGNESYPFTNPAGEFFFSSDGHPGIGRKDIFFTRLSDTTWLTPVYLDPPVNSLYDDFGIITDTLMTEGYFSSNRDKSIDIFHFKTNFSQTFYNTVQRENNYCFVFSDKGSIVIDTTILQFKWTFGDGKSARGAIVNHCFPGPGIYNIRLDIIDKVTGKLFFTKMVNEIVLRDFEQPYINSPDFVVKGDVAEFDGIESYLPGYKILSYTWDFGDRQRSFGEKVNHTFKDKGEYNVNLELALKSDSTGNIKKAGVSKTILVVNDLQEGKSYLTKKASEKDSLIDIRQHDNIVINTQYSAETEFQNYAVFCVELLSSKSQVGVKSPIFRNVPDLFTIKEKFNPVDGNYSYLVDQQMNLMATYPAFRKMGTLGFKDVQIKIFVLKDPSEKELHNLIKINGAYIDSYFDSSDRLTANAFIMLDQLVKLMNKYPSLRLEIAVHSDNTGSPEISLALSQKRSQLLVDYLINRGINTRRLIATGFGGSKPIASNFLEKDRKLNRRVDFIIVN